MVFQVTVCLYTQSNKGVSIQFCFKNVITATETFRMLQKAYGDDFLSKTLVFEWHRLFPEGPDDVGNDEHGQCDSWKWNLG